MFKKVISATLFLSALVLNANSLSAQESSSQNPTQSDTVFVCATQTQTPTLLAYTPGKINLTSLMSWHQEYLLPNQSGEEICQQVAAKLQNLWQQQQPIFFVAEQKEDRNVLCLVTQENDNCNSENSEELFSIQPNYNANCVVDNREPLECLAIAQNRGLMISPDDAYSPTWSFWAW